MNTQKLQFLQNSAESLPNYALLTKFEKESQTLQVCYNVEHFLQDSDNIFAKIAHVMKFLQKNAYAIFQRWNVDKNRLKIHSRFLWIFLYQLCLRNNVYKCFLNNV